MSNLYSNGGGSYRNSRRPSFSRDRGEDFEDGEVIDVGGPSRSSSHHSHRDNHYSRDDNGSRGHGDRNQHDRRRDGSYSNGYSKSSSNSYKDRQPLRPDHRRQHEPHHNQDNPSHSRQPLLPPPTPPTVQQHPPQSDQLVPPAPPDGPPPPSPPPPPPTDEAPPLPPTSIEQPSLTGRAKPPVKIKRPTTIKSEKEPERPAKSEKESQKDREEAASIAKENQQDKTKEKHRVEREQKTIETQKKPKRQPKSRTTEEELAAFGFKFVGSSEVTNYPADKKLGEGTFGEVHLATCIKTQQKVALKRVITHDKDTGIPITTIREIKILKRMNHVNVVPCIDMVLTKGDHSSDGRGKIFMVFPYMDHDLAGLLDNDKVQFTPSLIKLYMKQLLAGTAYLHSNHIIHRDMKAANLLIDNKGVLKIADFGLARFFNVSQAGKGTGVVDFDGNSTAELEMTNMVVTRWYRPPELILGEKSYGTSVDMWGIGCILGEMIKHTPIIRGETDLAQLTLIWKLCGTPTEETMPGWDKLPGHFPENYTGPGLFGFEKAHPYQNRIKQSFAGIGPEFVDLMEKLLCLNPNTRITAVDALSHKYFWTAPLAQDPSTLAEFSASHEFNRKKKPMPEFQSHQSNNFPDSGPNSLVIPRLGGGYGPPSQAPPPALFGQFPPPPGWQQPGGALPPPPAGYPVMPGGYGVPPPGPPPFYARPPPTAAVNVRDLNISRSSKPMPFVSKSGSSRPPGFIKPNPSQPAGPPPPLIASSSSSTAWNNANHYNGGVNRDHNNSRPHHHNGPPGLHHSRPHDGPSRPPGGDHYSNEDRSSSNSRPPPPSNGPIGWVPPRDREAGRGGDMGPGPDGGWHPKRREGPSEDGYTSNKRPRYDSNGGPPPPGGGDSLPYN